MYKMLRVLRPVTRAARTTLTGTQLTQYSQLTTERFIYCKSCNLPSTDVRNYSIDLR